MGKSHEQKVTAMKKRWANLKPTRHYTRRLTPEQIEEQARKDREFAQLIADNDKTRAFAREFCLHNCDNERGSHHLYCLVTLWGDDFGRKLLLIEKAR